MKDGNPAFRLFAVLLCVPLCLFLKFTLSTEGLVPFLAVFASTALLFWAVKIATTVYVSAEERSG